MSIPDAQALRLAVEAQLRCSWSALREHVQGPDFGPSLDLCWQGVLALNILLGDRRHQLDTLVKIIVLGHLLWRMMLLLDDPGNGQAAPAQPDPAFWTPARIGDGLAATPILPPALFPLPEAAAAPRTGERPDEVTPYAIGDLELVRQRLKGYAMGEVSRIDNLMRGEAQETTRRQLNRTSHSTIERGTTDTSNETVWSDASTVDFDLTQRSLNLEFEIDSKTTYGAPTDAIANESIVIKPNTDKSPQQQAVDRAAAYARTVTSRSVARLARRIEWKRASASLHEREDTVVNRLDGTRNERNLRGVYRWIDKVYEAHVVNYGHRLMLEFRLHRPAADFLREQRRLDGRAFCRPRPPGVPVYTDISATPGTAHYYADLIAAYEAYDVRLPPLAHKTLSASARIGVGKSLQELAIPDGYRATSATVSANWPAQGRPVDLFGLVGTQSFTMSSAGQALEGARSVMVELHGETGDLPFSIASAPQSAALHASGERRVAPVYVANIDIHLELTDAAFRDWQFGFYRAIQEAFQRRLQAWLETVGASGTGAPALAGRQDVQQALGRRVRQVLWRHALDRASLSARDETRYEQFFDQAFEWKEMSYSLGQGWQTGRLAATDSLLSAFVEADAARVLLPVHPAYQFCIPYFLDSGMVWAGDRRLVPAMAQSVDLVNDLKQCHGCEDGDRVRSQSWQFRVPTTMTVIQHDEELPTFDQEWSRP